MKSKYFYSEEQIEDMKHVLSISNVSIASLAREFAVKYNRGVIGVSMKLHSLAKDVVRLEKVKKPAYIKKGRTPKIVVEKVKSLPKVLGIDVPEGTSFDIQNVKRVVLQKKSLTIYF